MKEERKQLEPTAEVLAMRHIRITGNVIPPVWYQQLLTKAGKPNACAITILADLVYWYRPIEVRDEKTGKVVGLARKFRGNFLQRSYADLQATYGYTKKQCQTAFELLEKHNVAHRIFDAVRNGNQLQPNTMFLRLVPSTVKLLNDGALLPKSINALESVVTCRSQGSLPKGDNITKITNRDYYTSSSFGGKKITADDLADFAAIEAEKKPSPSSGRAPSFLADGHDRRAGKFDLENAYLERVGMGAKIQVEEVAAMMAYFLTKTEEGSSYYQAARLALHAKDDELSDPAVVCFEIAAKCKQHELQDWRQYCLPKLIKYLKYTLSDERAASRRTSRRTSIGGGKGGHAVTDQPSQFDYSENTGFDGK